MKIKAEYLLLIASVAATLVAALLVLRWLAPQLLGLPVDLRLVSVAKEVPPFYEGVFRREGPVQEAFILQDPISRVRALPLLPDEIVAGPHDVLGFRNFAVPATADVVVIGDSQTYGNNARLEENWPSQMARALGARRPVVYAMATGGWAATQYLQMAPYALRLRPRVVVLAFYSGNDAAESFAMAYGAQAWKSLRPNPSLGAGDLAAAPFPPPPGDVWQASLSGGTRIALTPKLRLFSNDASQPAIRAGWDIMSEATRRIAKLMKEGGVALIVTVIPTKELVYSARIAKSRLRPPPEYGRLVADETANIARFRSAAEASGVSFVDLVTPLQHAALEDPLLYPQNENGHPIREGYAVIAEAIARAVGERLPPRPRGVVAVQYSGREYAFFLVNDEGAWSATPEMLGKNGWPSQQVTLLDERTLATVPMRGPLLVVDRKRFGPEILGR